MKIKWKRSRHANAGCLSKAITSSLVRHGLLALITLSFSSGVNARVKQAHQCESNGVQRMVQLHVTGAAGVHCEVVYLKTMEDGSITRLWYAKYDAEFCSRQYADFIVKLESKLNFSCSATTASTRPGVAQLAMDAPWPAASLIDARSDNLQTEPQLVDHVQTEMPTANEIRVTEIDDTSDLYAARQGPSDEFAQVVPNDLSFALIRSIFPTGYYQATPELPHLGDTSLCPADGFYIWNTLRKNKPAFEMGPDTRFIINLGQFVEKRQVFNTGGLLIEPCNYEIESDYCMQAQNFGTRSFSNGVPSLKICSETAKPDRPFGSLSLTSSLRSESMPRECAADAPAGFMELTGLPMTSSEPGRQGFTLNIEHTDGATTIRRASCRYLAGK